MLLILKLLLLCTFVIHIYSSLKCVLGAKSLVLLTCSAVLWVSRRLSCVDFAGHGAGYRVIIKLLCHICMCVCVDIYVYVISSPYSFSSLLKCSVRIVRMYMFTVEPEWKARLSLHLSTRIKAQVSPSSLYLDQKGRPHFRLGTSIKWQTLSSLEMCR